MLHDKYTARSKFISDLNLSYLINYYTLNILKSTETYLTVLYMCVWLYESVCVQTRGRTRSLIEFKPTFPEMLTRD